MLILISRVGGTQTGAGRRAPFDGWGGGAHPQARRAIVMGELLYPLGLWINAHLVVERSCSRRGGACSFHSSERGDER